MTLGQGNTQNEKTKTSNFIDGIVCRSELCKQ